MSRLGLLLQESVSDDQRDGASRATILCFLREQMDVSDEASGRRRSLKERLGLKGLGCCGTTWRFRPSAVSADENEDAGDESPLEERGRTDDNDDDDDDNDGQRPQQPPPPLAGQDPDCSDPDPVRPAPGMNLAAALAAERQFRAAGEETTRTGGGTAPATPRRVSLMRLLEETTDGGDEVAAARGSDTVCCVCMGRKKGAAFIPCGHTFCRVCSRELWLNRGTCPLCNRPIIEILDIF